MAGTASQLGNTITGIGTNFLSSDIGSNLVFANGINAGVIQTVTNTTSCTVDKSQSVASQSFIISKLFLGSIGFSVIIDPVAKVSFSGMSLEKVDKMAYLQFWGFSEEPCDDAIMWYQVN